MKNKILKSIKIVILLLPVLFFLINFIPYLVSVSNKSLSSQGLELAYDNFLNSDLLKDYIIHQANDYHNPLCINLDDLNTMGFSGLYVRIIDSFYSIDSQFFNFFTLSAEAGNFNNYFIIINYFSYVLVVEIYFILFRFLLFIPQWIHSFLNRSYNKLCD